jgi:hypothetical protein
VTEKTVHELTVEFNDLAAQALERGVASWAVHHKSDFGSREVAEKQLARLRAELQPATSEVPPAPAHMTNWSTTFRPGEGAPEVVHLSMASDWTRALSLAAQAVRQDGLWPHSDPPAIIFVCRG